MQCPVCKSGETGVVDSRSIKEGLEVRRRRECEKCKFRFTTYETVDQSYPWVIKKDGRRQAFNIESIKAGLLKACEKRPVSIHQIDDLVNQLIRSILDRNEKEVKTADVGEEIMKRLKNLDQVAYVRFASVYREFKDINDFMSELSSLLTKKK